MVSIAGTNISDHRAGINVISSNQILVLFDIIKGIIATILGNYALPPMVRYFIGLIQPAFRINPSTEEIIIITVFFFITLYTYHIITNKIIKALVTIFLFVPIILMLLSFFTILKVPLPF